MIIWFCQKDVRGTGIFDSESELWLNSQPNELYIQNPVYLKYKSEEKKHKASKVKGKIEKEAVLVLPDTVGKYCFTYSISIIIFE